MATDRQGLPAQWPSAPPFYEHLGLTLDDLADGRSAIRLPYQKHFGHLSCAAAKMNKGRIK
jgi:acyl-coenzyme A thioesterase PaaI-like protein